MKKAVRVLFCMNLLVLTVLLFRLLTVKLIQIEQDDKTVSAQSENVKTRTEDMKKKKVALTFDDGPDPDYTEMLLDGLKERDVKATFFLLGKQAKLYPKVVKRMYKEGHVIGNHSYDHVNLATLSATDAKKQIEKTNDLIYEITGAYPQYLRPPFGNEPQDQKVAKDMITVLWDVDPLDWCCSSSSNITAKVEKNVKDGDIILLHDASQSSVEAALQIVDELTEKGYEFITVDKLILE